MSLHGKPPRRRPTNCRKGAVDPARRSWRLACEGARVLEYLTTRAAVGMFSNMAAALLLRTRIIFADNAFAELVLWRVTTRLPGSMHSFKYRLAYVVDQQCVLRYDNEAGKAGHRHRGNSERGYRFTTPEKLIDDFQADIKRWNDENRNA